MEKINSKVAGVLALRVLAYAPDCKPYSPLWNAYIAASLELKVEDDATFMGVTRVCDMFRFEISKLVRG